MQSLKTLEKRLQAVRAATEELRSASPARKNRVLSETARLLKTREPEILKANALDLGALPGKTPTAFRDRLLLDSQRIAHMQDSLKDLIALPDPMSEPMEQRVLRNGLSVRKARAPLGVIFMIFESRPNVAIEAFSLGFKASNAMVLRGGSESMKTAAVLYSILQEALEAGGFSKNCLWGITDPDRRIPGFLVQQIKYIDVVVPRGGDGLIQFVVENSRIPIIKNDRGLCHVYIHEDADHKMAADIVLNAKTQRPGVCNSMETLLVHEAVAAASLPLIYERLEQAGVQWFGCARTRAVLGRKKLLRPAGKTAFDTEYLDLKMNCRVVDSLEIAAQHIEKHGSRHSEAIVTRSESAARRFEAKVDAAVVYWNASTRFTDGFSLGLGGELGISTQKLHVRGPVGLRELTSLRWIIEGTGHVRGPK